MMPSAQTPEGRADTASRGGEEARALRRCVTPAREPQLACPGAVTTRSLHHHPWCPLHWHEARIWLAPPPDPPATPGSVLARVFRVVFRKHPAGLAALATGS